MKRLVLLSWNLCLLAGSLGAQSYNPLWIPDTLSGPVFNLFLKNGHMHFFEGDSTETMSINPDEHHAFWGPTLIFEHGDTVFMHVHNQLGGPDHPGHEDTSTIHWHGFHLPAVMDGGPHQPIPPNTTWSPYWLVKDSAATYWYHPHLHHHTSEQVLLGMGGLIIVRDNHERSLPLPRTYGVDDIPLVLSGRQFDSTNQILISRRIDYAQVNGTINAGYTLPAQVVRMRLLDAAAEYSFNVGFQTSQGSPVPFYAIGTDDGLLEAPVPLTRFLLSPGERVELLVDLGGMEGSGVDMISYNADTSIQNVGGFGMPGPDSLQGTNFRLIHFDVGPMTDEPITVVPTQLKTNTFYDPDDADVIRIIHLLLDTTLPGPPFRFDELFDINNINHIVTLGHTEIWELVNTSTFAHLFHIHDIQFHILSRNGQPAPPHEQGWKDVVLVRNGETVRFITRFADYADPAHPYMYHCHILPHEDGGAPHGPGGMMGQFVVIDNSLVTAEANAGNDLRVYPNPTAGWVNLEWPEPGDAPPFEVLDFFGKVMFRAEAGHERRLYCGDWPAGLYLLKTPDQDKGVLSAVFMKI